MGHCPGTQSRSLTNVQCVKQTGMKNVELKLVPYKFLMYMSSNMSTYFNLQ